MLVSKNSHVTDYCLMATWKNIKKSLLFGPGILRLVGNHPKVLSDHYAKMSGGNILPSRKF